MPDCPTENDLRLLLDEQLDDDALRIVSEHVEQCHQCQHALDGLTDETAGLLIGSDGASTLGPDDPAFESFVDRLRGQQLDGIDESVLPRAESIEFPRPPSDEAPLGHLGPYSIVEQISKGGTGLVYRAVDSRLNRTVAIKVLRGELAVTEQARERLAREARAVASLSHDHIVTLFEVGSEPDFPPYLVMEFVDGETLGQRLRRTGRIQPREAARLVREICLALAVAHRQGLVHRDVKPSNVLLDISTGRAKITDFGLARDDEHAKRLTVEGAIAGTPAYMSPEQIVSPDVLDARSDVYSLGVVLYELLTGDVPFEGTVRATLTQIMHDEPRPPRQLNDAVPIDLETICLKAMSKEPSHRYESAAHLAGDLQRWLDGRPILARPISHAGRFWRWCKRSPRVAGLSAAVFGLLMIVAVGSTIASITLAAARDDARDSEIEARAAETKANDAAADARAAEELATENAEAATKQRDLALETLQKLIYQVHDELDGDVVDLDEVQKSLMDIALDGLRDIAKTTGDREKVDRNTVDAHLRLGVILSRLEQYDEGRKHLLQARTILARLAEEMPGDSGLDHRTIEIDRNLGHLEFDRDNYDVAIGHYSQVLARCRSLAAGAPKDSNAKRNLAIALDDLSDAAWFKDALDPALQYSLQSLDVWSALFKRDAKDERFVIGLIECYERLGDICVDLEQPTRAKKYLQKLLDVGTVRLQQAPKSLPARVKILTALATLGEIHESAGELNKAGRQFRQALDFAQEIYLEMPWDETAAYHVSVMLGMIADLAAAEEDFLRMRSTRMEQYDFLWGYNDNYGLDGDLTNELAECNLALAKDRLRVNKTKAARDHFIETVDLFTVDTEDDELTLADWQFLFEAQFGIAKLDFGDGDDAAGQKRLSAADVTLKRIETDDSVAEDEALQAWVKQQRQTVAGLEQATNRAED
jgi:tetratricopeptide (TPR) repeat protein